MSQLRRLLLDGRDSRARCVREDLSRANGHRVGRDQRTNLLAARFSPRVRIYARPSYARPRRCMPGRGCSLGSLVSRRKLFLEILGRIIAAPLSRRERRSGLLSLLNARVAGESFNYFAP